MTANALSPASLSGMPDIAQRLVRFHSIDIHARPIRAGRGGLPDLRGAGPLPANTLHDIDGARSVRIDGPLISR